MKKLILKRYTKPFMIVITSLLALLIGFRVIYAQTTIVSARQLIQNQNLVYDVQFKNEEAIGKISAPRIDYGGFFMQSTIAYDVEGIAPSDQNIAYFVYPMVDLAANSKYRVDVKFKFSSDASQTQELLVSSTNVPVSQGPQIEDPTHFTTNIDPSKLEVKRFYVQSGLTQYQSDFEITTNKEGQSFLLVGIKTGKNEQIKFNIGDLTIKLQPISNDSI